jgi:preprotein translocase subunit YajC
MVSIGPLELIVIIALGVGVYFLIVAVVRKSEKKRRKI